MTVKKTIDGLYYTIGMMLFNPLTGETKTPDSLNEDDKTTYDACKSAIELLKPQEEIKPIKSYVPSKNGRRSAVFTCGNCLIEDIGYGVNYCYNCGRKVDWS